MNLKNIHIGHMIKDRVTESDLEISRICNFLKCKEGEIWEMYQSESLDTEILLRWSKLLRYDFFRVYSQHLILYTPLKTGENKAKANTSSLPQFRKNIYTKEVIEFILNIINSGEMTRQQVIERYRIPKTTLYKWVNKYNTVQK